MSQDDDDMERKKELWQQTSPEFRMFELVEKLSKRVESDAEESRLRNEETQRNIEFIVQQQAQFAVDIQKLGEAQTRTEQVVERLATATLNRFEAVESELESKMEALVDSHIRLTDSHEKLAEAQKQSDERLNAFINTVERLISERRNGGQGSGGF